MTSTEYNGRTPSPHLSKANGATNVPNLVGSCDSEQDEKKPLLTESKRDLWNPPIRKYVPVEIVAVGYFFSTVLCLPLVQFYLVEKVSEQYGGVNTSESSLCSPSTTNSTNPSVEVKIQDKAAEYTIFLLLAISFPGIIQTFFLGSLSDKQGRRGSLLIALTGLVLRQIIYLVVFELDLSLWYLFLGNVLDGLSGSFGTVLTAMFGIVADITPPGHKRATRIVIVQAAMAIASALGSLLSGLWIDSAGFKQPLYFVIALTGFTLLFVVFVLPETRRNRQNEPVSLKEHLKSFKKSFQLYTKDTEEKRRWKLVVSLFTFITSFAVTLTIVSVLLLYLLALPFCWQRTTISGYASARGLVGWLCILLLTSQCGRYLSEITIAIIGCASNSLFLLIIGLARSDSIVILAAVTGVLSDAAPPMVRSVMSRLVSPDEQGALFASISAVEMIATAVIGVGATVIYKASLSFFPGLIFVIMACLTFITALLLGALRYFMKDDPAESSETSIDRRGS